MLFLSTLPVWGATSPTGIWGTDGKFLSTLPVWGATIERQRAANAGDVSIHAPRVGSDLRLSPRSNSHWLFLSTLPVWGATETAASPESTLVFLSTLPVWGATAGQAVGRQSVRRCFYPRSPCGERRGSRNLLRRDLGGFYPRSPCGERPVRPLRLYRSPQSFYPRSPCGERHTELFFDDSVEQFLSTLPVWGATLKKCGPSPQDGGFYPRSPCGERRGAAQGKRDGSTVSIHAPRVGSDQSTINALTGQVEFLSTLPVWGATARKGNFADSFKFLSTLPVWGATVRWRVDGPAGRVSIHAPRVGSDCRPALAASAVEEVSIHAPRVGSDVQVCGCQIH